LQAEATARRCRWQEARERTPGEVIARDGAAARMAQVLIRAPQTTSMRRLMPRFFANLTSIHARALRRRAF